MRFADEHSITHKGTLSPKRDEKSLLTATCWTKRACQEIWNRKGQLSGGDRCWLGLLLRILKYSASGLAAQPSGFHVLDQQGRGAEFLTQRFVEVFEDVQACVEPDQID